MEGKIHRVTYNAVRKILELHLKNEEIKEIPMSNQEWIDIFSKGCDIKKKLEKYLDD